ncbi:hypothetical protein SSX86_004540 [Deinandra increscens subsp. villosa]|uniref:Uncharacterized protein n=1 Tax=Deinandra increscens subsp. villosa TaxID=3103831 RepID=A0AAP0DNS1_9ASTR
MTNIIARSHGGDGNGEGPPEEGTHLLVAERMNTVRPVGTNASDFKTLLGVTVRTTIPLPHDSWDEVPEKSRTAIWPQLKTYFDLKPYLNDQNRRVQFENGIMKLCENCYSQAKYKFKQKHFIKHGGRDNADAIRLIVPPQMKTQEEWSKLVDFYCRPEAIHRSMVNSTNRSHQPYPSRQGTKSFVETRFDRHEAEGHYPSLIEGFWKNHTKDGSIPLPALAQQQYDRMNELLGQQQGAANPMSEKEILDEVLGKRRGFKRGRGHIVPGMRYCSSSSMPGPSTDPLERVYTKAEVDAMMAKAEKKIDDVFDLEKVERKTGFDPEKNLGGKLHLQQADVAN